MTTSAIASSVGGTSMPSALAVGRHPKGRRLLFPGAPRDSVDARDQLILVERFGHVVVGTVAETPDFVLDARTA